MLIFYKVESSNNKYTIFESCETCLGSFVKKHNYLSEIEAYHLLK